MGEIMEQGKWTSTNRTKSQSSSKEGDVVYMAGLEGNSVLWELPSFPGSSVGKESTRNAGDPVLLPGSGRSSGEWIGYPPQYSCAPLKAQLVKNQPAMWETWDPWSWDLEKGKAPLFWPGEFHGLYSPWSRKESDTTEWFSLSLSLLWTPSGRPISSNK